MEKIKKETRGQIRQFFGIKLIKNIPNWQQCARFRKSQKVLNHFTLNYAYFRLFAHC